MNYDKIDTLLMAAGCRFEFLHGRDYEDFSPYKFAELIVEECVDVLLKWKGQPFPFDEDLAANLIKEHFGVK